VAIVNAWRVICVGSYHFVIAEWRTNGAESNRVKYWEIIIKNLRNAGWNCGSMTTTDGKGRQFWVVAAERENARRFIVRADEKLTAFLELESTVHTAISCHVRLSPISKLGDA
jgi:hypothetical protein